MKTNGQKRMKTKSGWLSKCAAIHTLLNFNAASHTRFATRNLWRLRIKCIRKSCHKFKLKFKGQYGKGKKHGVQVIDGVAVHWNTDGSDWKHESEHPIVLWAMVDEDKGADGSDPVAKSARPWIDNCEVRHTLSCKS